MREITEADVLLGTDGRYAVVEAEGPRDLEPIYAALLALSEVDERVPASLLARLVDLPAEEVHLALGALELQGRVRISFHVSCPGCRRRAGGWGVGDKVPLGARMRCERCGREHLVERRSLFALYRPSTAS